MGKTSEFFKSFGQQPAKEAEGDPVRKRDARVGAQKAYQNAVQSSRRFSNLSKPPGDTQVDDHSSNRDQQRNWPRRKKEKPQKSQKDPEETPQSSRKSLNQSPRSEGVDAGAGTQDDIRPKSSGSPIGNEPSWMSYDLPRATDHKEISEAEPDAELQLMQNGGSGDDGNDLIALTQRMYKDIRQVKIEFPSESLKGDMPDRYQPEYFETAFQNLIQAYRSFHETVFFWSAKAREYEREISELSDENKENDKEIIRLQTVAKTLREEYSVWERNHEGKVKKIQDGHRSQMQKLESEVRLLKSTHDTATKELKKKHRDIENDFKDDMTKVQRKLDASKLEAQKSLKATTESNKKQLEERESRYNDEKRRMNNEFLREKNTFSSTLNSQKENYETQIVNLRDQNSQREKFVEEEYGKEMEAMDKAKRDLEQYYLGQLSSVQANHDMDTNRIKDEHESKMLAMRESYEARLLQENQTLRDTIETLKTQLVKRSHFKAMSDQDIARHFQKIASEIDECARVEWESRRESTWPFPERLLVRSVNDRITKLQIIQNTIWVILYERIFCTPFRVFGAGGKPLELEWTKEYGQDRKSAGARSRCPPATRDSEKWRYDKIKECQEATNKPLMSWEPFHDVKQGFESNVKDTVEEITQELMRVGSLRSSDKQRIGDLTRKAAMLWLEVGQQRCRIFVIMSSSSKEPSRGGLATMDRDRVQELVVVPELRRLGNAQGERLEKDELVLDCKGSFTVLQL